MAHVASSRKGSWTTSQCERHIDKKAYSAAPMANQVVRRKSSGMGAKMLDLAIMGAAVGCRMNTRNKLYHEIVEVE